MISRFMRAANQAVLNTGSRPTTRAYSNGNSFLGESESLFDLIGLLKRTVSYQPFFKSSDAAIKAGLFALDEFRGIQDDWKISVKKNQELQEGMYRLQFLPEDVAEVQKKLDADSQRAVEELKDAQ